YAAAGGVRSGPAAGGGRGGRAAGDVLRGPRRNPPLLAAAPGRRRPVRAAAAPRLGPGAGPVGGPRGDPRPRPAAAAVQRAPGRTRNRLPALHAEPAGRPRDRARIADRSRPPARLA